MQEPIQQPGPVPGQIPGASEPSTLGSDQPATDVSEAAVRAQLEQIRTVRGRIMPNHAVLAIEDPALLARYEALYAGTTLSFTVLTPQQKKFVLLLVVSGTETPLGPYHVRDFLAVGGTAAQVRAALRLAMLVIGASTLDSVGPGWSQFVPDLTYEAFFNPAWIAEAIDSGVEPWVVELALVVGHACRRAWPKVGFHIVRAKALGVTDAQLSEALTTLILTAGNPIFAQACGVWQGLIAAQQIDASPLHRYAAQLSSQS